MQFCTNLYTLLMKRPLGSTAVLGVDPVSTMPPIASPGRSTFGWLARSDAALWLQIVLVFTISGLWGLRMQGFSHGCKLAVIDGQGAVLECSTVHPFASKHGAATVRPAALTRAYVEGLTSLAEPSLV